MTVSKTLKSVFTAVDWLSPNRIVIVKRWVSTAPISTMPLLIRVITALVGGEGTAIEGGQCVAAGVDRGAAGQKRHRLGRAAIVSQRAEQWIDVEDVRRLREAAAAGRVADQVVS